MAPHVPILPYETGHRAPRRARIRFACVVVATLLALCTTTAFGVASYRLAQELGDEPQSFCGNCQMAIKRERAPEESELRRRCGVTVTAAVASLVLGVNAIRLKHRLTE